jgi:hypothetical protein
MRLRQNEACTMALCLLLVGAACGDEAGVSEADASGSGELASDGSDEDALAEDDGLDSGPEEDALPEADLGAGDAEVPTDAVAPPGQPVALFSGADPTWGASPWPDDRMRGPDGTLRLPGFDTNGVAFAEAYRDLVETDVFGYPLMPVVYFPLSEAPAALSAFDPRGTLSSGSAVRLIAFPDDATCSVQVPLEIAVFDAESPYLPAPALMATPVHGHELAPATRYAAVLGASAVTPSLARSPAFEAAWSAADEPLAALRACLGARGDEVVSATVFTTADTSAELAGFVSHVTSPAVAIEALDGWTRVEGQSTESREVWAGTLPMPIYQAGDSPYDAPGSGGLVTKGDGPQVQRREGAPVTVAWSTAAQSGQRPVLVWVGGTGIRQFGHLSAEPVKAALKDGFVVVSMLPQFHGVRAVEGSDPVLSTFNYLNPLAGRAVLRQQAIETAYLARWVRETLAGLEPVPQVDTGRLTYGGHSQGSLAGALLAGVSDDFSAWVFGGLGGHLSTTLVERKDYLDIQALVALAIGEPLELVTRYHPIVQLAQVGGDVVDPASYARLWRGRDGGHAGGHAFVVNASADATTPVRSVDSITIASGSAVAGENLWDFDPFQLGGVALDEGEVAGNVQTPSGASVTIVSWLFAGGDHFELLDRPEVGVAAAKFLRAASTGAVPVFSRQQQAEAP